MDAQLLEVHAKEQYDTEVANGQMFTHPASWNDPAFFLSRLAFDLIDIAPWTD